MRRLGQAAAAAVLGLLLLGARADAQNINVVINGQPVTFTGAPPQELNGSVLVPLRGVFEQLGATVQYNPTTQNIFAQKGSTTVSLTLGSSTAYVNNQAQQLAQPPTVLTGTTLVPLRFVAEAFGAYVEWQPQTNQSAAISVGPPPAPVQTPAPGPQISTVEGRIISVDNPGNPGVVTIETQSGPVAINLDERTKVSVDQPNGGQPIPSAPEALRVGTHVSAKVWPNGNARFIEVQAHHDDDDRDHHQTSGTTVSGRILNIDNVGGPSLITVGTPSGPVQIGVDQSTTVGEQWDNGQGHQVSTEALRVGDDVTAQLFPNGNAQSIQIDDQERHGKVLAVQNLPGGDQAVVLDNGQIVQIDHHATILHDHHPAPRPIQAGDNISVRLRQGSQTGYSVDLDF